MENSSMENGLDNWRASSTFYSFHIWNMNHVYPKYSIVQNLVLLGFQRKRRRKKQQREDFAQVNEAVVSSRHLATTEVSQPFVKVVRSLWIVPQSFLES